MSCEEFKKWMEEAPSADMKKVPSELEGHISECPDCQKNMSALKKFGETFQKLEPSMKEIREMKDFVFAEEAPRDSLADGIVNFFENLFGKQLAFALSILLVVGLAGTMLYFQHSSGIKTGLGKISISCTSGIIEHANGSHEELSSAPKEAFEGERFASAAGSKSTIQLASCGKIEITNRAVLVLREKAVKVEEGVFTAEFFRSGEPFKLLVPQATLVVMGTKIDFNIASESGFLDLIEGNVEVVPQNSSQTSFIWKTSTRLRITQSSIVEEPAKAQPGIPPGEDPRGKPNGSKTGTSLRENY